MSAILIDDGAIGGWVLLSIQRVWSLTDPIEWQCSMLRLADGAVVTYRSLAGIKQAYEGCARLSREAGEAK